MALIKLLIFDDDDEYSFNLCKYLTHNYSETFIVNYFGKAYNVQEWIEKTEPDIVLTCEKLYSQISENFIKHIIILTSGRNTLDIKDVQTIYKFKDVNQIAGDIINIFTKNENIIKNAREKTPKIIAVWSAGGNVGKTTVSLGISNTCSFSGLSVFYLNLELFQSTNLFFSCNSEYSITDIIYYAKERDKNLASKILTMSCKDESTNIHYFKEPNNVFEINELNPQDINFIISSIRECGQYDLIVIDMDSQLNENTLNLLKMADEIIYVLTDEEICLHKTRLFLYNLNLLSNTQDQNTFLAHKIYYAANKVSKQALHNLNSFHEFKVTSQIPYDPKLHSLSTLSKLNGGPEAIYSVFKEISKRYI